MIEATPTEHTDRVNADALRALVQAASLAPFSHNTQPWLFRIGEATLHLLADRTRALPVNDAHDRELTISCGCALFNIRVAAAAAGLQAKVDTLPDTLDPDVLARVHVSPGATGRDLAHLLSAVADRRTYRERFAVTQVEADKLHRLVNAATTEDATLSLLESADQRLGAAALVAEGDETQWANQSWRRELAVWMHPRRRGDGLTMPALAVPVAQIVVRTFDMGHGVGARDRQLADESPVLAVLSTAGDGPRDWLLAGQALQRVLLTGVYLGLQASYLNQPAQVATLRARLQQLTGLPGHAQLLLRLGVPIKSLPAAPRRRIEDLVVEP